MREVKKNIDNLNKNLNQVRNLAKKDPSDQFDQVMSGFFEEASKEYALCTTLKGADFKISNKINFKKFKRFYT